MPCETCQKARRALKALFGKGETMERVPGLELDFGRSKAYRRPDGSGVYQGGGSDGVQIDDVDEALLHAQALTNHSLWLLHLDAEPSSLEAGEAWVADEVERLRGERDSEETPNHHWLDEPRA